MPIASTGCLSGREYPHLHTHKSFTGAVGCSAGNRGLRFATARERQRRVQAGRWPEWLGALTQPHSSRSRSRGRHGLCKIRVVSSRDAERKKRKTTPCQRHPQRERRRRTASAGQDWASKEQKWAKVVGKSGGPDTRAGLKMSGHPFQWQTP